MTHSTQRLCLLVAEVAGGELFSEVLGPAEATYALERCLNRMSRSAEAYAALSLEQNREGLVAQFPDPDGAMLAAREMRERVRALPPMRGVKLSLRAGVLTLNEAGSEPELARRLAGLMIEEGEQDSVLVSESFVEELVAPLRRLFALYPKAASALPFRVFALGEGVPPSVAELRRGAAAGESRQQLQLTFQGQSWVVDATRPTLLFGRETGNDIVLTDPRVSRQHARIELRQGSFVLVDSSTNGTYLLGDGAAAETCLKKSEASLGERGQIGCGCSAADNPQQAVSFMLK